MKCLGGPLRSARQCYCYSPGIKSVIAGHFSSLPLADTNIFLIVIYFDDDKNISKFPSLVCRISPSKMLSVMMTWCFCYNHGLVK